MTAQEIIAEQRVALANSRETLANFDGEVTKKYVENALNILALSLDFAEMVEQSRINQLLTIRRIVLANASATLKLRQIDEYTNKHIPTIL